MGHTNKTAKFSLPQFVLKDIPQMADFNNAFKNIDDKAVSKSGDTMTGSLTTTKDVFVNGGYGRLAHGSNGVQMEVRTAIGKTTERRLLALYDSAVSEIKNALKITEVDADDKISSYSVYHAGNKPSGSYTGNGSATSRTIQTGGIGKAVYLQSSQGGVILTGTTGIVWNANGIRIIAYSSAHFANGEITLKTEDAAVNANGIAYSYEVL